MELAVVVYSRNKHTETWTAGVKLLCEQENFPKHSGNYTYHLF
jgi:hypothetical protein